MGNRAGLLAKLKASSSNTLYGLNTYCTLSLGDVELLYYCTGWKLVQQLPASLCFHPQLMDLPPLGPNQLLERTRGGGLCVGLMNKWFHGWQSLLWSSWTFNHQTWTHITCYVNSQQCSQFLFISHHMLTIAVIKEPHDTARFLQNTQRLCTFTFHLIINIKNSLRKQMPPPQLFRSHLCNACLRILPRVRE